MAPIVSKPILPNQNPDVLYLTDSGMETTFVFLDGVELPCFAAFTLLMDEKGRNHLKQYYRRHVALSDKIDAETGNQQLGFVLEGTTWRSNSDWLKKMGYGDEKLQEISDISIQLMREVQAEFPDIPMVVSGTIGPRADGYVTAEKMTAEEAKEYHKPQILALQKAGADMVSAITMNYMEEGLGIALAAQEVGIPVVLSFTVETDGCLVTGQTLQDLVESIDQKTNQGPAYYMINCAHPTHFSDTLANASKEWLQRIGGIRANASKLSHAELDNAEELDDGNPDEFGKEHRDLLDILPKVNVIGGCCGTDVRHVAQVRLKCARAFPRKTGAVVPCVSNNDGN